MSFNKSSGSALVEFISEAKRCQKAHHTIFVWSLYIDVGNISRYQERPLSASSVGKDALQCSFHID